MFHSQSFLFRNDLSLEVLENIDAEYAGTINDSSF